MFKDLLVEDISDRLKKERKAWGMSRRRLARLSHTDKETIEEIEYGNLKNLDFELLMRICEALEISAFSFLKKGTTVEELLAVI